MTQPAKLALEDGTVFTGTSFGADGEVDGEVCFNTSMTGYQEILTDPSYRGQIVTMTYPRSATTASTPRMSRAASRTWPGFIVREFSRAAEQLPLARSRSMRTSSGTASSASRASTRGRWSAGCAIRGAMKGVLSSVDLDDASLVAKAKASPGLVGRDLVREVMPDASRASGTSGLVHWAKLPAEANPAFAGERFARRRPRLRHEVEHRPAPARRGLPRHDPARHGDGRGSAGAQARRRVPLATAPAIPSRWTTPRDASAACWARSRSSASAWGINCSAWPAGPRRSSSSSATAARISRC